MTIKERLREIKYIDGRIDSLLRQIERLRDMSGAIDYSQEKVKGGKCEDISNTVVKIDLYERAINREIDSLVEKKQELKEIVDKLKSPYWDVVNMYYFERGVTWEKISVDLNISYRQTMRLHGTALKKLEILEKMAQNVT